MKSLLLAFILTAGLAAAQTCPTPAQLDSDLTGASQGDLVDLAGTSPLVCPEVPMVETWTGGSLLFSDSPESPSAKGKLYEDTFAATCCSSTK